MKTVRAVCLSVAEILVKQDHRAEHEAEWEAVKGLPPGAVRHALWGGPWWQEYITGRRTVDSYHRAVAEALHMRFPDEVMRFIELFYAGEQVDDALLALVARLRPRYRVSLVTDAGPEQQIQLLHKFGLDTRVASDDHLISGVVGVAKPSPILFQLACERLGVAPDEAVMVDTAAANVEAARSIGMQGVLYAGLPALLEALQALSVNV
ncbi:MAG: HAD-IA family hydrolase [Anaerolineae bacterium]|nr:HAD-IA family hydrolase [Anaerolineae bacterium]